MLRDFALLLGCLQFQVALLAEPIRKDGSVTQMALKTPLRFEPNMGQADGSVKFLARGTDYTMLLQGNQMVMRLNGSKNRRTPSAIRMNLLNGRNGSGTRTETLLSSVTNYYPGNDSKNWRTAVPNYGMVRFESVYPGIDLVYYGNEGQLEYDFVVHPGADPSKIRLQFSGADSIRLSATGDLVLSTSGREIVQRKPFIYQTVDGKRVEVAGNYRLSGAKREVQFALSNYDRSKTLVIDPVVVWATYLGGTGDDYGFGISVDGGGAAYVVGRTTGAFPVLNSVQGIAGGGEDVFVTKYTSGGALVYSTYLGGTGIDSGASIAVQSTGETYITGSTSGNFPLLNPAQSTIGGLQDGFVTKLSTNGIVVYSTYLGGSGNDAGRKIAVDATGAAYVTGETSGGTFPVSGASQGTFGGGTGDAFVTKYGPFGTVVYSTYLGGTTADIGRGIAVDLTGAVYVTGTTLGGFPVLNAAQTTFGGTKDAFVTKLASTGAVVYSTYLGGVNQEDGQDVAADSTGSVFVTGNAGPAFPTLNATQSQFGGGEADAFVTKIGGSGQILFSTYFGGPAVDIGQGIAVDGGGAAYITGVAFGTIPVVNAVQPASGGSVDAFVLKINASGSIRYATYLGGAGEESGADIAVDAAGAAYVTGFVFLGQFPVKNPAQPTFGGGAWDAFVAQIGPEASTRIGSYTGGLWKLDANGNGTFDVSSDPNFALGFAGATVVTGDWNGDGRTKAGVYANGYWFLDYDGNGVWDNGVVDKLIGWGWAGVTPVVGDWNGDGKDKIGVFSNGFWFLDYNGDYLWDGGTIDKQIGWGWVGVTPLVGDWNGNGKTKIGVYSNGFWFLDYNGDYLWDGGVIDKQVGWGWTGVTTIVGDWNGDGKTKIGVYAGGYWYLDYDGNYLWEYPAKDRVWQMGWAGTTPVTGDWSGDGRTKAGAFINGYWYLDFDGSGNFDGHGVDRIFAFGAAGDAPQTGFWVW